MTTYPRSIHVLGTPETSAFETFERRMAALRPAVAVTQGDEPPDHIDLLVGGRPSEQHLSPPPLRTLVVPYAGVPRSTCRRVRATRPELVVYNLHDNAAVCAEHAVALLLCLSRGLLAPHAALASGDWRHRFEESGRSLAGARALVLGFGHIGRRVARTLAALELDVRGVRAHPERSAGAEIEVGGVDDLDRWLADTDVLVVTLPLTSETEGLVDAARLQSLPRDALLVNVGRGPVIDEDALWHALEGGHLGGAALDVWWQYPRAGEPGETPQGRPSKHPFHELDNVVLSPHRAANLQDRAARRFEVLADLIAAIRAGTPPRPVDLTRGY